MVDTLATTVKELDAKQQLLQTETKVELATIRAELTFHRWAFGAIFAVQIAILMKVW